MQEGESVNVAAGDTIWDEDERGGTGQWQVEDARRPLIYQAKRDTDIFQRVGNFKWMSRDRWVESKAKGKIGGDGILEGDTLGIKEL